VRETLDVRLGALVHPHWADDFPWLVQGTTTRRAGADGRDYGWFSGGSPEALVRESWSALLAATSMREAVHARQVHEADVRVHDAPESGGIRQVDPCDGHATCAPDVLLAVSVADCVPVFLVDSETRSVAMLHAGWRGAAAGILESGLAALEARAGARASSVRVHLGPAICAACYEVGPEVFAALGLTPPSAASPLDLRGALAGRAVARGVTPGHVTVSTHCTRCTGSELYSHRGGDRGRQVRYLGVRP